MSGAASTAQRLLDAKRTLERNARAWSFICERTDLVFCHVRSQARHEWQVVAAERLLGLAMYKWLLPAWMLSSAGDHAPTFLPLPQLWRRTCAEQGVRPAGLSGVGWLGLGCAIIAHAVRRAFVMTFRRISRAEKPEVMVMDGSPAQIPPATASTAGREWYLTSFLRRTRQVQGTIGLVMAGNPTSHVDSRDGVSLHADWLPPLGFMRRMQFAALSVLDTFAAIVQHFAGNPWVAAALKDRMEARWAALAAPSDLASCYIFFNSHYCYRPLWTSAAAQRGARIELLFYSTNCESVRVDAHTPWHIPGYRGMRWPHCTVWDQAQADFVHEVTSGQAKCAIEGPISLSDCETPVPAYTRPVLALFDVPIQTDWAMASKGIAGTYYAPETVAAFISDVAEAAHELGITAVLKGKRDLGTNVHPVHAQARERAMQQGLLILDDRVAAGRLLQHVDAAIAVPFTSPVIIGQRMGLPSAFYDPWGTVVRPQRGDHGVPTICSKAELRQWMLEWSTAARARATQHSAGAQQSQQSR